MKIYWCDHCKVPIIGSINTNIKSDNDKGNIRQYFYEKYQDIDDLILSKALETDSDTENIFFKYKSKKKEIDDWIKAKKLVINKWYSENKEKDIKYPDKVEKSYEALLNTVNGKYNKFISNLNAEYDIIIGYQKIRFDEITQHLIHKYKKLLKLIINDKNKIKRYLDRHLQYTDRLLIDKSTQNKYFCPECGNELVYLSQDIRPVFMKERILLSEILDKDFTNKSIWKDTNSKYFVDGKAANFTMSDIYNTKNLDKKIKEIIKSIDENDKKVDFSKFIKINSEHINYLKSYSSEIINKAKDVFSNRFQIVSFSGGKDSTVISDLVTKALHNNNILHVFGDTTLEFPSTYEYVDRIKDNNSPPFLTPDKSRHNFFKLVDKIGPPSRINSWCCHIFKTGPIGKLLQDIAKETKILTYYGIRRNESIGRSQYSKITKSPKIKKQVVFSPIIDWKEIDIWLYLLKEELDFNVAYEYGYTRVGCWMCPNNSKWSEFLNKIFLSDQYKKWNDQLINFAKDIGKLDPKDYISDGKWKARHGGRGLESYSPIDESEPCNSKDNVKTYNLSRKITPELYELFKPFGILDKTIGNPLLNEVFILNHKTNEPLFSLQGNIGSKQLKINIIQEKNVRLLLQRIECQLRKFQNCIYCGACRNICPQDAISLTNGYKIDENKCTHCMECVAKFHKGCLIVKALEDYKK
ncbi:MAG: phosphoadenosine phosphosulfate reductase family protein [Halanaerobiales bacterium]|nr:phosphoadenosine phosphosulfate reductase family protein [Halanaerobiales bacterium]MCF8008224.1 phosphoadenosine phosphosulfate reductase family protein [Halanaerobiales bacterium]